jgi:hypothetical protein
MRVWNAWAPTQNFFLKLLKPCSSLLKNNFKLKKKLRQVLLNSSKTWTQPVFKIPDNRPALVITKQKNLQIGKFRKLKKMSPTRSSYGWLSSWKVMFAWVIEPKFLGQLKFSHDSLGQMGRSSQGRMLL